MYNYENRRIYIPSLERRSAELRHYIRNYKQLNKDEELAVVFDLGTKAARLLVGPKWKADEKPTPFERFSKWDPDNENIFFVAGHPTEMGGEFDYHNQRIDLNSKSLGETIYFINVFKRELLGFSPKDITVTGTAVFRWPNEQNKKEVIAKIKAETGLTLEIIDEKTEAYLSMVGVMLTYDKVGDNRFPIKKFTAKDIILLFDQGGGSTEVSFVLPTLRRFGGLDSMTHIGTVALKEFFFRKGAMSGPMIDSAKSLRKVSETIINAREFIAEKIQKLRGFDDILPESDFRKHEGYQLHAYGMGSAIQNCFESHFHKKGKTLNGWELTIEDINKTLDAYAKDVVDNELTIDIIVEDAAGDKKKKSQLLYGVPVYEMLLKKFGLNSIRYGYYNLKFGIFIQKYVLGFEDLSTQHFEQIPGMDNGSRVRVFISYTHENKAEVDEIVSKLEENTRIVVRRDERHLKVGDDIRDWEIREIKELTNIDKILVCFSPEYKAKVDDPDGLSGAKLEFKIIQNRLFNKDDGLRETTEKQYTPVIIKGEKGESLPEGLQDTLFIDFTKEKKPYEQLMKELFDEN